LRSSTSSAAARTRSPANLAGSAIACLVIVAGGRGAAAVSGGISYAALFSIIGAIKSAHIVYRVDATALSADQRRPALTRERGSP
jgi:hypothetical protein